MKRVLQAAIVLSIFAALALPALAEAQTSPPRSQVKELFNWAPRWVRSGSGSWDCMDEGPNGWAPKAGCTPKVSNEPVLHLTNLRSYTRDIYAVTFTEKVNCPAPQVYSADVVFENYQEEFKITD